MSTADQLLVQMFSWIEQREGCARQLHKLTDELKHLKKSSNTWPKSDTMTEAKKIGSKGVEIKQNIQRLFTRLRAEWKQTASIDDPNDLDQHIMSEICRAMARRNGLEHHITKKMFKQSDFSSGATSDKSLGNNIFKTDLTIGLAGILSFFTLEASGRTFTSLFAKGAQQLGKEISTTGLKTVLKGGTMSIGGVIGLAFELLEAIDHWRDLIKKNNATEASRSLRDTADALQKINRTLRKKMDKIKEMLKDFDKLKSCIENPNRSDQQKADFIEVVRRYCQNQTVLNWLSQNYDTQIFFRLVDTFYFLKQELDRQRWNLNQVNIDTIFVGHGSIGDPLIPASDLLPMSTIEDVILYSPWNCAVDSKVVYSIATGRLQTQHRVFNCTQRCGCRNNLRHQPRSLPPNWNSMRNAGDSQIANILVRPLKHPEDPAWNGVLFLGARLGEPGRNIVVIPYIIPGYQGDDDSMTIPFALVTLALSLVLFVFPFRARVHLGACLSRTSQTALLNLDEYLAQQYAVTRDFTMMTSSDTVFDEYPQLYNALRAEFN